LFFIFCFSGIIYAEEWNDPLGKADLLLFSSHADDEHLFFAGVLPYCVANEIKAQVVYTTNHNDNPIRNTELLQGLWAVGIRNKPVISRFPDLFSESLEEALRAYKSRGFTEDDFIVFCVENIRRFKPQVAVGHDINGEYGHGTHILSSRALMKAVVLAGDENYHKKSFAEYGVWDTPKTYINLWNERRISLSINEPLHFFNGKTAFQVSQYGFTYHKSQHWTWFNGWLNGTAQSPIRNSKQIRRYQPGNYGLYRTVVGEDSADAADFFENTVLIKDIKRLKDILKGVIEKIAVKTESAAEAEDTVIAEAQGEPENDIKPEKFENIQLYLKLIPVFIIILAAVLLLFLRNRSKSM